MGPGFGAGWWRVGDAVRAVPNLNNIKIIIFLCYHNIIVYNCLDNPNLNEQMNKFSLTAIGKYQFYVGNGGLGGVSND